MPTFKADYSYYDAQMQQQENLERLFDAHNAFVRKISATLNNLDEENFNDAFFRQLKDTEEEDG